MRIGSKITCKECGEIFSIKNYNQVFCERYSGKDNCYLKDSKRQNIKFWKKIKDDVYSHYGSSCACCGEKEKKFLTIDHKENDGAEHRRKINRGGSSTLLWLKKNGYPSGFQILCWNCNSAKGIYGKCPHSLL